MRFRLGVAIGFGVGYYLGTAAGRERYEEINRYINKLKRTDVYETATEKTKAVVRLRFGLDDGQARTLEEVGKEFGVTRERIRQIESKTMSKLRHPSRSQVLRDYLD